MNNKNVKLYHLGTWYKAYNDDFKIVSFITNYKLLRIAKLDNYVLDFQNMY